MSYDILEITWIIFGLFFGIGQVILTVAVACAPQDKDALIGYYRVMLPRMEIILRFSSVPMIVPIVFTWLFAVSDCDYAAYVLAISVTILAPSIYLISLNVVIDKIYQARLISC